MGTDTDTLQTVRERPWEPSDGYPDAHEAEDPTLDTLALRPSPSTASGATTTAGTVRSPADAMRNDEVRRMNVFTRLMLGTSGSAIAIPFVVDGDPLASRLMVAASVVIFLGYALLERMSRTAETYRDRLALGIAQVQEASSAIVVYYFGVFSPYPAVVTIALYLWSLIGNFRFAAAGYLNLALGQALVAGLVVSGTIEDRGLIDAHGLDVVDQIVLQLAIQGFYFMAFVLGRFSRARTLEVVTELEHTVREVSRRQAILDEARQELEQAAGIGGPGRFTEQTIGVYRLGFVVGRGGMGEVYEAVDVRTGEPAAVKLLRRGALGDAGMLERFGREVRIASSLETPHVVRVLDVGDGDAAIPYIAMERLRGRDLSEILREQTRLSAEDTLDMVTQISRGLAVVREAGVIHRDLKPHNIFHAESGEKRRVWKILDFGVSKQAAGAATVTQGQVLGTPAYMAPEQARGETVDHRADVFSLGVITYRCLTGHPAFSGRDIHAVMYDVVYNTPTRPSRLAPLPEAVDRVLATAMAKSPEDRFARAEGFAEALRHALGNRLSSGGIGRGT